MPSVISVEEARARILSRIAVPVLYFMVHRGSEKVVSIHKEENHDSQ